ncbi:MAG: hypothetical protein ACTS7I_00385 [Candidatus Hodgkinia cicadicola]
MRLPLKLRISCEAVETNVNGINASTYERNYHGGDCNQCANRSDRRYVKPLTNYVRSGLMQLRNRSWNES